MTSSVGTSAQRSTSEAKSTKLRKQQKKNHGVNPWIPNQHGAWAMLILPVVVGLVTAMITSPVGIGFHMMVGMLAIVVAWVMGYFCFFAFGLWFKARSAARKKAYVKPTVVYGGITAVATTVAFVFHPWLVGWVVPFAPLIAIALWELYHSRPRSLASGISTTVASSLMYPVMVSAGAGYFIAFSPGVLTTTLLIGLYFTGTIFYVKTIIREKGNTQFHRVSVIYHVLSLVALVPIAFLMTFDAYLITGLAGIIVLLTSLARAIVVPRLATKNPQQWTPKLAGIREIPLVLVLGIGCCLTYVI